MRIIYVKPKNVGLTSLLVMAFLFLSVFQLKAQKAEPTSSGLADVNGIKMYYEVYGEGDRVVLLHGAFYTIDMNWSELIPELAKTRKVIAIEFQGHGHSPYSDRKLDLKSLASDVAGVMDYLKVESADIVGFSMGGSVAYQLVVRNPEKVRKLVIISSTYKSSGWLPEVNNAFDGFTPEIFEDSPMKADYEAIAPDKSKWTNFIEQMIEFAGVPFSIDDSDIAKISSPVLLIAGDNDGLDKIELMKTYQLLGGGITADMSPMPKSHLAVVPAQGHVSLMMQTQTLFGYLDDFLK